EFVDAEQVLVGKLDLHGEPRMNSIAPQQSKEIRPRRPLDAEASQAWRELLQEMDRRGIAILPLDNTALTAYASLHGEWVGAMKQLARLRPMAKRVSRKPRPLSFSMARSQRIW